MPADPVTPSRRCSRKNDPGHTKAKFRTWNACTDWDGCPDGYEPFCKELSNGDVAGYCAKCEGECKYGEDDCLKYTDDVAGISVHKCGCVPAL